MTDIKYSGSFILNSVLSNNILLSYNKNKIIFDTNSNEAKRYNIIIKIDNKKIDIELKEVEENTKKKIKDPHLVITDNSIPPCYIV
jgi:hypothetical protein